MTYKKLQTKLLLLALLVAILFPVSAFAAEKKGSTGEEKDISGEVTRSYDADPTVQIGMIVKLKDKDPKTVVPLDEEHADRILGVVVPQNNATIVLTPQNVNAQQVLVTNKGHFSLIVSNQNGPIKVGDFIMVSAIAGVGMKADDKSNTQVVGKATGEFNGTANVIGQVELKDTLGRKTSVSLGRIPIDVAISHNPLFEKKADYVPSGLAKLAQAVTDKPVSAARIYLGSIVLLVVAYMTAMILYSGIRHGMVSIGRNPLSRQHVMKGLIQTIVTGLIIFIAGIFGVYLLLKF